MKLYKIALATVMLYSGSIYAQNTKPEASLSLIPLPTHVEQGNGSFVFGNKIKVYADAYQGDSIQWVLNQFEKNLTYSTGKQFKKQSVRVGQICSFYWFQALKQRHISCQYRQVK